MRGPDCEDIWEDVEGILDLGVRRGVCGLPVILLM